MYEENLEEEKRGKPTVNSDYVDKSVDLMKKLNDYLGK
jgi:hypothetical protein